MPRLSTAVRGAADVQRKQTETTADGCFRGSIIAVTHYPLLDYVCALERLTICEKCIMMRQEYRGAVSPKGILFVIGLLLCYSIFIHRNGCDRSRHLLLGSHPHQTATGSTTSCTACTASAVCEVTTTYVPSELEIAWLENVHKWQVDFCNSTGVTSPQHAVLVQRWLQAVQEQRAVKRGVRYDPKVFSTFVTKTTCSQKYTAHRKNLNSSHEIAWTTTETTWIEPLANALRHPLSLCGGENDANIMDMDYLLISSSRDLAAKEAHGSRACHNRSCQSIFFDLGATMYSNDDSEAGQGWFIRSYQQQGIEFDRILLWEARPQEPEEIYAQLPHELMHTYQYFNVPTTNDTSDPAHVMNMLLKIAQPGDFVVFKLDIDNWEVESSILKALTDNREAFNLVDEFFFEYHVNFEPMIGYWGFEQSDSNKSLADAYRLFYELRQRGWRAHSWV